jgi:hypothetical protein
LPESLLTLSSRYSSSPQSLQRVIQQIEDLIEYKNTPCNPETCSMHPDHQHVGANDTQKESKKEDA